MSQEITPNTQPPIKKLRDIAVGFFGWVIFSNLILLLTYREFVGARGNLIVIGLWIFAVIATIVLFFRKRNWVSTGIVAAVIINIGLWMVILLVLRLLSWEMIKSAVGVPLPLGIFLLFLQ